MDIYRARWIIPVEGPPLEHGFLAVEQGRVAALGPGEQIESLGASQATVHELGDTVLLPGFVNAHTHLELTSYHDRLSPGPLWPWLEGLIALRRREHAADLEAAGVRSGAAASLDAGVTTVGDISRTGIAAAILKDSPLRKVCFVELISGASQPPNDDASLKNVYENLLHLAEPDRLVIGISPHAPYSVTEEDLKAATALARTAGAPLTMHLLETREEARWLADGGGPMADLILSHGLPRAAARFGGDFGALLGCFAGLSGRQLLAHVNYLTDRQLDSLAACGAGVAWCPRAHRFFGHAGHRWREMLARGINVCIGTDSLASNASLSILDELRWLHRQVPDCPADLILEMGTLRGARGLGLDDLVGSLRPGKRADFVAVPWESSGPTTAAANLLESHAAVSHVWIDGRTAFPGTKP